MRADIQWWIDQITESAYPVRVFKLSVVIKTVASKRRGEGVCDGRRTGGSWTAEEAMLHINCHELKALLALQSLCMGYKNYHARLLSDTCISVACINKFGSTKEKCNDVTRGIWLWWLRINNFVQTVHLPGSKNVEANEKSRTDRREGEWKLDPVVFKAVQAKLGVCDNVDLSASRVNNQPDRYAAWQPDPGAWQIDAFSLDWNDFSPYCFPPFCFIPRILIKD